MRIISGNSHPILFKGLCDTLGVCPIKAQITRFNDHEIRVEILESLANQEIFIMQSICNPINDNLMELLLLIDSLKRSSVSQINLLIPYFGYSRQDKITPHVPSIAVKLVSDLMSISGAHMIITVDLHSPQIEKFFNVPLHNLSAMEIFANDIKEKFNLSEVVIVSPDLGGMKRARNLSSFLNVDLVLLNKYRNPSQQVEVKYSKGDIKGKICILLDDLVDTANTLHQSSLLLKEYGARSIHAYVTHGVLSLDAINKIEHSSINSCTITDTIPLTVNTCHKVRILSIVTLLREAVEKYRKK